MLCGLVADWKCKLTAWNFARFRDVTNLGAMFVRVVVSKVRQTGLIGSYSDSLRSKRPMIMLENQHNEGPSDVWAWLLVRDYPGFTTQSSLRRRSNEVGSCVPTSPVLCRVHTVQYRNLDTLVLGCRLLPPEPTTAGYPLLSAPEPFRLPLSTCRVCRLPIEPRPVSARLLTAVGQELRLFSWGRS